MEDVLAYKSQFKHNNLLILLAYKFIDIIRVEDWKNNKLWILVNETYKAINHVFRLFTEI